MMTGGEGEGVFLEYLEYLANFGLLVSGVISVLLLEFD